MSSSLDRVLVEVNLSAVIGFDEPVPCVLQHATDMTVGRGLMSLDLPAAAPYPILKLPACQIERLVDGCVQILVDSGKLSGLVVRPFLEMPLDAMECRLVRDHDFIPWDVHTDSHVVAIASLMMLVRDLHRHSAAHDVTCESG